MLLRKAKRPNNGSRRRWRDASDGYRFGDWQRPWSTAPARLNLVLDLDLVTPILARSLVYLVTH